MKEFKDEIYFAKLREDAIIPSKRDEDMCYDIYLNFAEDMYYLYPNETKLIPTGICGAFDKKYGISLRERGSNGSLGIKISAGQIDSGFRGEWKVAVTNCSRKLVIISKQVKDVVESSAVIHYPYTKAIAQAKVEVVPQINVIEKAVDEIMEMTSERGMGMIGSSGK